MEETSVVEPAVPVEPADPVEAAEPLDSAVPLVPATPVTTAVPVEPSVPVEAIPEEVVVVEAPVDQKKVSIIDEPSVVEPTTEQAVQIDDDVEGSSETETVMEQEDIDIEDSPAFFERLRSTLEIGRHSEITNSLSFSDDELDSYDLDLEYLRKKKLSFQRDFFIDLGTVPSLSGISISLEEESTPEVEEEVDETRDLGQFVDPLTGEILSSTSSSVEISEDLVTDYVQEEDSTEISSLASTIFAKDEESIDIDFETMLKVTEPKSDQTGIALEELLNRIEKEQQKKIQISTERFVHSLVDKVVDKIEGRSALILIAGKVDKIALLRELYEDINHLLVQKRLNNYLTSKVADSFSRKKQFRPLKPESPENLHAVYTNYVAALNKLDFKLLKEFQTKEKYTKLLETQRMQFEISQEAALQAERSMDEEIYKTLIRPDCSPRLRTFVEKNIKKIHAQTLELAMTRRSFIKIAHKNALLKEKQQEIEQIEPGITLTNHEYAILKTSKMCARIDELKTSIAKHSDEHKIILHLLAHIREELWISNMLIEDNNKLIEQLTDKLNTLAKQQMSEKLKKVALQDELTEMELKVGLLARPLLMQDYDKTMERLELSTQTVQRLRSEFDRIRRRSEYKRSFQKKK